MVSVSHSEKTTKIGGNGIKIGTLRIAVITNDERQFQDEARADFNINIGLHLGLTIIKEVIKKLAVNTLSVVEFHVRVVFKVGSYNKTEVFEMKEKGKVSSYHRLEELLTQSQARPERNVFISSLVGKCLPFFSQHGFNGEADGISEMKGSRFYVMFCFTLQDCAYCLKNEIITWNEFHKSYNHEVCQVIGVTDTVGIGNIDQIVSSMHIKFPVFSAPNLHSYLAEYRITSTPAVFFGDGTSKKIIYSHFPTTANLSSDGFTGKLQMILDACKH